MPFYSAFARESGTMAERPRRRSEGVTMGITSKCRKEVYPKVAQCHHDIGAFFTTTLLSRPVALGPRPGGPQ